jgi:hypothetical protein
MAMFRSYVMTTATSLALAALCGPSAAQESQASKAKMTEALAASARGECAENIMSPLLLDACEQQITANRRILAPLGGILDARFMGMQDMGNGMKAEAYRVNFERGTMMWFSSLDSAGKLLVMWSNGQVRPK